MEETGQKVELSKRNEAAEAADKTLLVRQGSKAIQNPTRPLLRPIQFLEPCSWGWPLGCPSGMLGLDLCRVSYHPQTEGLTWMTGKASERNLLDK